MKTTILNQMTNEVMQYLFSDSFEAIDTLISEFDLELVSAA